MDAAETVLSRFREYFDRSPKAGGSFNERTIIFPRFDEKTILRLLDQSNMKLQPLGSLIYVYPPVIYVGDVHGNLTDLLRIFHVFGLPPKTKYLFLGDYVDRGSHSIAVISILFALSIKFPGSIYLIRGNHEFKSINKNYGFYEEVISTYGSDDVWQKANEVFGYLPLAAVVGDQVFCVHGGLSPALNTLSAVQGISLPIPLYESNRLIADLVWSDPVGNIKTFEENNRGTGVLYGSEAISLFLKLNKLKLILRGHQCVANGYSLDCANMCVTLFSSSNYCRLLQNRCAVIQHDTNRELSFYIIQDDSDFNLKPKVTMVLASGQQLGLRSVVKAQPRKITGTIPNGCPPRPPRKSTRPLSLHPGIPIGSLISSPIGSSSIGSSSIGSSISSPIGSSISSPIGSSSIGSSSIGSSSIGSPYSSINTHSGSQSSRISTTPTSSYSTNISTSSNISSNISPSIALTSRLEPKTRYNSISTIPHYSQTSKVNSKISTSLSSNTNINLNSNIGVSSPIGSSYSFKPNSPTRSSSSLIRSNSTMSIASSFSNSSLSSSSYTGSTLSGTGISSTVPSSSLVPKIGSSRPPPLNLTMLNINGIGSSSSSIPQAPSSARVMRKGMPFRSRSAYEL